MVNNCDLPANEALSGCTTRQYFCTPGQCRRGLYNRINFIPVAALSSSLTSALALVTTPLSAALIEWLRKELEAKTALAELYEAELKKSDSTTKEMSKDMNRLEARLYQLKKAYL